MALIGKAIKTIKQGAQESVETALRTSFPGMTTTASTLSKLAKEANDRKARELSQESDSHQKNTLEKKEFYFFFDNVKKLSSVNPWQLFMKAFRWIAPGFSNIDAYKAALQQMDRLATYKKANYYAYEAAEFFLDKLRSQVNSRGLIARVMNSTDDLKGDPYLEAHINSASSWLKAVDHNSDTDKLNLRDLRAKLLDMPEFIKDKLSTLIDQKLQS